MEQIFSVYMMLRRQFRLVRLVEKLKKFNESCIVPDHPIYLI